MLRQYNPHAAKMTARATRDRYFDVVKPARNQHNHAALLQDPAGVYSKQREKLFSSTSLPIRIQTGMSPVQ